MTTFEELDLACRLLSPLLARKRIRGAGIVGGSLDLALFFDERPHEIRQALRIACGPPVRARVLLEEVRLRKKDYLEGESSRHLEQILPGATLQSLATAPGERRILVDFEKDEGARYQLMVECFGPRGNWFLLDGQGRILAEAWRPGGGRAALIPGALYQPPLGGGGRKGSQAPLPESPSAWLEERALSYGALDAKALFEKRVRTVERTLAREEKALRSKRTGLRERQKAEAGAEDLRREGELLLTSPQPKLRGLSRIRVQDWYADGVEREILLDQRLSISDNAERRFRRAKRLLDGALHTQAQLETCDADLARLDVLHTLLERLRPLQDLEGLRDLEDRIQEQIRPRKRGPAAKAKKKETRLPYRKFRSQEGYPILVGKTNRDNDRLSMSIAKGNDWWMHIGQGYGGSHVVIRVPRGKTPALETLLDAGHLALHFSKARGRGEAEVLYTQRKHLRKRKGAKPGAVEVTRSKSLQIRVEPKRLARLLEDIEDEG